MKILQSLFILLVCVCISGCSPDGNNVFSLPQFTANVDGEIFTSSEGFAAIAGGRLSITGTNSTGDVIVLSVLNFDEEQNTYDLSAMTSIGSGTYLENGADNSFNSLLEGGSGSLTITDFDQQNSTISGIFNFIGIQESIDGDVITTETINITAGEFTNLIVSGVSDVPDSNNGNFFNALIDGEVFSPDSAQASSLTLNGVTSVIVSAIDSSTGQSIGLNFSGGITVGTFDLVSLPLGNEYTATYSPDINNAEIINTPVANTGSTVTIDRYDETTGEIEGSFQFTAGDPTGQSDITFEITEGEFSLTLL